MEFAYLGEGMVDEKFISMLIRSDYRGPISLHVEYLEEEGVPENLGALADDLQTLLSWIEG